MKLRCATLAFSAVFLAGALVWPPALARVPVADEEIRRALDKDISFIARPSAALAEFFRAATIESIKPFLNSEQLLQQAARYAEDANLITFLIASGFEPNEAYGPGIPAEYSCGAGEQRAGPLHDAARYNADPSIAEALVNGGADLRATGGRALYTPLHYAARHNSAAVVSALLRSGAQPNDVNGQIDPAWDKSPNVNGNTALHVAAGTDNAAVMDALVAAGADVQQVNASGFAPLHVAVVRGHKAALSALLRHGADPNAAVALVADGTPMVDCTGCNPIHLLVDSLRNQDLVLEEARSLLKLLLDAGGDINAKVAQHRYRGYSALRLAVKSDLGPDAVALLLESGAKVDSDSLRTVVASSLASEGNLRVFDLLIGKNVDVNAADSLGTTLLHMAARRGALDIAWALIDAQADPQAKDASGRTPLDVAAAGGHLDFVTALLHSSPHTVAESIDPEVLERLLAQAMERDAADTVLRLLDGVDAEEFGFYPLHEAAKHDSPRVAQALLDAGLSPNATGSRYGWTPLHEAASLESTAVAALLIEHGAEVNARDNFGWTPLHLALGARTSPFPRQPGRQTAHLLLEHGADAQAATDVMGWTPLHLASHLSGSEVRENGDDWEAEEFGHGPDVSELVHTLIERGANVNAKAHAGGWTPLRVVKKSDGWQQNGPNAGANAIVVRDSLQAAGGRDEGCDDGPQVPDYVVGVELLPEEEEERRRAGVAAPCQFDMPLAKGGAMGHGGQLVRGSFTAPGANERLLTRFWGITLSAVEHLTFLQDRHGAIRPIMFRGRYDDFQGLCLDRQTNTHTAVFKRTRADNCCEGEWYQHFHYDAVVGTLARTYEDARRPPLGKDEACRWREEMRSDYAFVLTQLRVGKLPGLPRDGTPAALPSRAIASDVVPRVRQLLHLMPGIATVSYRGWWGDRWRTLIVERVGELAPDLTQACDGVLLVEDRRRERSDEEWRSLYDCARFSNIKISRDMLVARLEGSTECDIKRPDAPCYLEVDLATRQARLRDQPHDNSKPDSLPQR